jgi:polyhydroxyalkanoate synthesis regulator phasin
MRKILLSIAIIGLSVTSCTNQLEDDLSDIQNQLTELQAQNEQQNAAILVIINNLSNQIQELQQGQNSNSELLNNMNVLLNNILGQMALFENNQEAQQTLIDSLVVLVNDLLEVIGDDLNDIQNDVEDIYDQLEEILDVLNSSSPGDIDALQAQIEALLAQLEALQNTTANIEDIDIDAYDVTVGNGNQLMISYEADVENSDIDIEKVDIYLYMDEYPWETFETIRLKLTSGTTIVVTGLQDKNLWHELGGQNYRLRINNFSDTVNSNDEIDHSIYVELQNTANNVDIEVYTNVRYVNENGIIDYFETNKVEVEVED